MTTSEHGYAIDHVPAAARCCELHNVNCEPPSDLCCAECSEVIHFGPHGLGVSGCVLDRCACPSKLAHLASTQPGYAGSRIGMREPIRKDACDDVAAR